MRRRAVSDGHRRNGRRLVARMLRMEPFRSAAYTVKLFRQALFTQLLEANIAVTRQTRPGHPVRALA
jgi:hypothetical protein